MSGDTPDRIWIDPDYIAVSTAPDGARLGSWRSAPDEHKRVGYCREDGPTFTALVEAARELVEHDAFEPRYLSADLNAKLGALRAALRRVTGEGGT